METKHTPGPFEVRDTHPQRAALKLFDAKGNEIAVLYSAPGDTDDEDADGVWRNDHVRVANANLFAAAPELLVALSALYGALDSCVELTPTLMQHARAAIANATGSAA